MFAEIDLLGLFPGRAYQATPAHTLLLYSKLHLRKTTTIITFHGLLHNAQRFISQIFLMKLTTCSFNFKLLFDRGALGSTYWSRKVLTDFLLRGILCSNAKPDHIFVINPRWNHMQLSGFVNITQQFLIQLIISVKSKTHQSQLKIKIWITNL